MSSYFRFLIIVTLCSSLLSCSSPQSQQRLDTVLCWLRPSCLPSELPSPSENVSQADPASEPINTAVSSDGSQPLSPQVSSSGIRDASDCLTSAQITVTASNPVVSISYIEPTTKANGQALTNLAKTTIYQDIGKGLLKYKEIKATNSAGGGNIREKVSFSLKPEETIQATICITATDTNGQES